MHTRLLSLLVLSLVVTLPVQAAGNAQAGQSKAAACAGCHGADGNSPSDAFPKIAGQHEEYIARQLALFKNGGRQNALMAGMAAALSEQDMADLGAYFEGQVIQPGAADEDKVALGEALYRGGDAQAGVPACMACHGPAGKGNGPAGYPALGGQYAGYIAARLKDFRNGTVWGKGEQANTIMASVAAGLSDEQIEALASYIQGLH